MIYGGRWAADPGNSYRNAKRFLRFPISVTLNPAQRARDSNPKPDWGFHPQTPSSLRGGFNKLYPQLSLRDRGVEGAGNVVPCRELEGGALNVFHFFTQKKL